MSDPERDNGKGFQYLSDLSIDEPVVSFDLFDTVIQRRYLSAHEVHETVSAHACALLGRYGIDDPRALTNARYHTTNLMKASQTRPTQEPSVNAVWQRIIGAEVDNAAIVDAYVDQLVTLELAIERDNLFVVEGAVDFIGLLKSRNKVVIAVTDMYFSREDMTGLLSHLGLLSLFDHLFVSADVGLTKQTGDLFALVARTVSVEPRDILHVGDNRISDHDNARAAGLNAILIAHDTTLQRPSYGRRANIFREVADLNKVFLLDTLLLSRSQRVEHIYFLARDGCLMKGVLDRMAGPVADSLLNGITYSELFLNRSATCWGSLDFSADWLIQAIGLAFWLNGGRATADQLLATLGAPSGDGEFGGNLLDALTDAIGLADRIRLRGLDQEIRQALERKRSELRAYLTGIGFFGKRRVAFCDLGYSGSAARDLNAFLVQEEIDTPGLRTPVAYLNLMASNENFERNSIASLPHVRFNAPILLTTDRLTDDLQHNFAWLELFFKHPTMQPVRQFRELDGQVVPDVEHAARPDHPVPSEQVLAVSGWASEDIALLWLASQRSLASFVAPVVERFAAPDLDTVSQVSRATYEADAVGGTLRSALLIDPYLSEREIDEIARSNDYWIAGSVVASAAARDALVGEDITADDDWHPPAALRRLPFDIARPFASRRFDVHFYRAFYSDLAAFDDDFLLNHYREHGRSEGRFPSAEHLIRSLATYGALPVDFDPYIYVWLHPDLRERLPHPLHGYSHYLQHGRTERRGYSYSNPEVEHDFAEMVADGSLVLTARERRRLEHAPAARIFFERFSMKFGGWIDLLVPAEFRLLNEPWAAAAATKGQCLRLFLEQGLARGAPLSILSAFVADEYRRYEPNARSLSDEDAYRHWLAVGFYLGRAPSQAAAIDRAIGASDFPAAFDWKGFAATRQTLTQADRVVVLDVFVGAPAVDQLPFVKGEGAASLLFVLGNRALLSGRAHDAAICLEAGLALGGHRALFLHRLGDAFQFAELPQRALSAFTEAVEEEGVSRWSFINGAELALALGQLQLALHFVDRGRRRWDNLKPWRRVRDLVYGRCYELEVQEAAKQANRVANLKAAVERAVRRCERDLPTSKPTSVITGAILIVTGRPFNSSTSVTRDDREVRIFSPQSLGEAHSELFDAATLIVHDLPVSYAVLNLVLAARRAGVDTICFLGPLDTIDGIDLSCVAWQDAGWPGKALTLPLAPQYVCAASVFDRIVTRFAALAGSLAAFAAGTAVQCRGLGLLPMAHLDPATVMLVGGWRIDEQMRRRVIAGLKRWAKMTEAAVLVLDDSFDQDLARRQLSCRVEMVDVARHLDDVGALVQQVGALVEISDGADFSFAAEAASAGVPSFSLAVQPGQKGLAARALDDLSASIGSILAASPILTQRPSALLGLHEPKGVVGADTLASPSRAPTAPKILLLNVYFPPQSIGGATRVLKDNLDFFLDAGENPDRFVVVTTDLGNDVPGEVLLDSYRGVRIYRLSTPQEIDMDWRTVNLNVAALMHRILRVEQPGLVHVHCVPRLSASSLDECRKAGIPYIVTLHDAWWISDYPFLTDGGGLGKEPRQELVRQDYIARIGARGSWSRGSMVRDLLTAARRRLAVSAPFAQVYRQCGIQCDVLENGVSQMRGPERPPAASDVVQLCHVGGLEHHKGAYILEIALKRLSCQRLAVTVIDLGQDTGSEQNVMWGATPVRKIGRLPASQMEEFYASMNVLVAPSTWPESFGLVTREATRLGLWVISSRLGAMGGGVLPGVNGFLVDVDSTAELMEVLEQIEDDPPRFQTPPDRTAMRTSDEQAMELLCIYRASAEVAP